MVRSSKAYRIIALMMTFLMFVTSTGFAVDMHYCQGHFKSFAVIGKAKSCHSGQKPGKVCPFHGQAGLHTDVQKSDCCQNVKYVVQSDLDKQSVSNATDRSRTLEHFVVAHATVFAGIDTVETFTPEYLNYKPPLLQEDIPVRLQTFLL